MPPAGYGYYKTFPINGTVAGAQTLYQMKLTVYKGAGVDSAGVVYLNGHCQDDFDDIRFTTSDGSTLLDFWIESMVSGTSAVFWIEFDSIPISPGAATFYIYYSNSGASSASDENATALYGYAEDVEPSNSWADTLDTGWSVSTDYAVSGTHSFKMSAKSGQPLLSSYVWKSGSLTWPSVTVIVETAYWMNANVYGDYHHVFTYMDSIHTNWKGPHVAIQSGTLQWYDGSWHQTGLTMPLQQWVFFRMVLKPATSKFDVYTSLDRVTWTQRITDGSYIAAISGGTAFTSNLFSTYNGAGNSSLIYGDNYFWRSYTSPEPTWGTWGDETATGTAWTLSLSDTVAIADSISKAMGVARSETIGLADTIAKGMGIAKTDSVGVADAISKGPSLNKADSIGITESLAKSIGVRKTDAVSLSDSPVKALGVAKVDTVAVTDIISKRTSLVKADSIGIVDSISKRIGLAKSDSVSLSDRPAKSIGVARADTVTVTDAVSKGMGMTRADTIGITDAISKGIGLVRAETIAIVDSLHSFTARTKQTWTLIAKLGNRIPWSKRR